MRVLILVLLFMVVSCKNEPNQKSETAESVAQLPTASSELEVFNYEGLKKYLTTQSDSTYVVNFWATWCGPCVKEMPYFEQLNANYADSKVAVILVSLDFPKKYETALKPFIKNKQLKSKVVALNDPDANSWIPKVSEDWSGAIPATLIFNKDKRRFYEQSFTYDVLETELKQFLK